MSAENPKAERHLRTRGDHANETAEDYVEAIEDICRTHDRCRVTDLASHFGVSHVTVSKIRQRLQREGWIRSETRGAIELTAKGKRLAARSRRRHQIVQQFLVAIGVSPRIAEIDAEGIEHHVSEESLRMMSRAMVRIRSRSGGSGS